MIGVSKALGRAMRSFGILCCVRVLRAKPPIHPHACSQRGVATRMLDSAATVAECDVMRYPAVVGRQCGNAWAALYEMV